MNKKGTMMSNTFKAEYVFCNYKVSTTIVHYLTTECGARKQIMLPVSRYFTTEEEAIDYKHYLTLLQKPEANVQTKYSKAIRVEKVDDQTNV